MCYYIDRFCFDKWPQEIKDQWLIFYDEHLKIKKELTEATLLGSYSQLEHLLNTMVEFAKQAGINAADITSEKLEQYRAGYLVERDKFLQESDKEPWLTPEDEFFKPPKGGKPN